MASSPSKASPCVPILRLIGLSIGYTSTVITIGEKPINAYRDQTIALIGRNGCGKTTLLRAIAGLLHPLAGEVLADNIPIASLPPREKARLVAFAPTRHTPDGNVRVKELVMLARFPHQGWFKTTSPHDYAAVETAMRLTQTIPFADRPIGTLSDGERQRVWLAMALAQETPILLLDEPSAFLDFPSKGDLVVLLRQLARTTHRLIIYSTHDLQSALWCSDRLWIARNATLYDTLPEEAARSGILNAVFGTESSTFDPESFTFTLRTKNASNRPRFRIVSAPEDPDFLYARRVLLRLGWQEAIMDNSGVITITKAQNGAAWRLPDGEQADSLESLSAWAERQLGMIGGNENSM